MCTFTFADWCVWDTLKLFSGQIVFVFYARVLRANWFLAGNGVWMSSGESSTSSAEIKNLLPYTEYEFKVACSNDVGQGKNSTVLSTKTGQYKPSAPTSLHAEYLEVGKVPIVQVSWYPPDFPNGEITWVVTSSHFVLAFEKMSKDVKTDMRSTKRSL